MFDLMALKKAYYSNRIDRLGCCKFSRVGLKNHSLISLGLFVSSLIPTNSSDHNLAPSLLKNVSPVRKCLINNYILLSDMNL